MPECIVDPRRPMTWVLDFDGTITKRDTLDALVNIFAEAHPDKPISSAWHNVTQAYLTDYTAALAQYAPSGLPTTVEAERRLLKNLEEVEQRSIDRVSRSKIFSGLTSAQLRSGATKAVEGGRVQIRAGLDSFLHHILKLEGEEDILSESASILSVNWSKTFIAACLEAARSDFNRPHPSPVCAVSPRSTLSLSSQLQQQVTSPEMPMITRIFANELAGLENGGQSTGNICTDSHRKIISSSGKTAVLRDLRGLKEGRVKSIPIVYIGDSWTDFECLLDADLGICIRDHSTTSSQTALADSLKRMGIRCPHIQDWKEANEWNVVWARDFVEIREWAEKLGPAVATI